MTKATYEISEVIITEIGDGIKTLLKRHLKNINEAFKNDNNNAKISLGTSIAVDKGAISIETKINLVKERVKDSISTTIDEKQLKLFTKKKGDNQK